jgi:hypothetical protein
MPLQRTLALLKRDLANIAMPGGTLSGTLQTTATSAGSSGANVAAPSRMTASTLGAGQSFQASPDIYTATGVVDETTPWAEMQKVAYFLVQSTNRGESRDLYRSVSRNLLPPVVDTPVAERLMGGVLDMAFYYYDGTEWRGDWDSTTEEAKLPRAIRVSIELAPPETAERRLPPVELVVPLEVQALTNAATSASSSQTGGSQAGGAQSGPSQPSGGGQR